MPGEEIQAGTLQQEQEVFSPEDQEAEVQEPSPEERLGQRLSVLERILQEQDNRLRGVHSISDRTTAALDQLKNSLEERFGRTEKTMTIFGELIKSTLGEDALREYERQDHQSQLEELRHKLDSKLEEPKPVSGTQEPSAEANLVDHEFHFTIIPELREYADQMGVALELVINKLPTERGIPSTTDPRGWRGYVRAAKEVLRKEKARLENQAKPRTSIDTTHGVGAARVDALAAYKEKLAKGEALPSREEIDHLTAKYAAGT